MCVCVCVCINGSCTRVEAISLRRAHTTAHSLCTENIPPPCFETGCKYERQLFKQHIQVLLAMMVRLVRQELADGSASPVTDQLLRMRPETSTMEFMLWVAQQEGLAPPGPDKEVGGTHTFARNYNKRHGSLTAQMRILTSHTQKHMRTHCTHTRARTHTHTHTHIHTHTYTITYICTNLHTRRCFSCETITHDYPHTGM